MTKQYLVIRHGVYPQGLVGIFTDQQDAMSALREAKANEPDDYHSFYVYPVELNKRYDPDGHDDILFPQMVRVLGGHP